MIRVVRPRDLQVPTTVQWPLYNPAAFETREICWIREGTRLKNLIYCCNVHEEDILATENRAGLSGAGL